jgi:4-amino-4-deoxy-L-arabinose transferase-like glycosyltransferase
LLGIGTILMTIDPPLVLCWTLALIAGWRAAQSDGKTRDWLVVGFVMGLGFLCKYTAAVQLVCWVIFFALQPSARAHLRKRGPWLALLIFVICTTPVIIWNWQHGWITVTHVAGDAGMHSQWKPTLRYFWDFIFSQAGLLNPIFFVGSIWAMFGFWKFRRERPLWLVISLSRPAKLAGRRRATDVLFNGRLLERKISQWRALRKTIFNRRTDNWFYRRRAHV